MTFEVLEIKAKDKDNPDIIVVSGIANKVNIVDLGRDMTVKGTFTKTVHEKPTVPTLAAHDHREPIGLALLSEGKDGSLLAELHINMLVQKGAEFISLIKQYLAAKSPMQMSMGYFIRAVEFKEIDKVQVRILKEVQVFEVSVVPVGMNPASDITKLKKDIADMQVKIDKYEADSEDEAEIARLKKSIEAKQKIIGGFFIE